MISNITIQTGTVGDHQLIGISWLSVCREEGSRVVIVQWLILVETFRGKGLKDVAIVCYQLIAMGCDIVEHIGYTACIKELHAVVAWRGWRVEVVM